MPKPKHTQYDTPIDNQTPAKPTKRTYRLHDGRTLHAVQETPPGWHAMTFLKCGDGHIQPEEQAALAFHDDKLKAWLKRWD